MKNLILLLAKGKKKKLIILDDGINKELHDLYNSINIAKDKEKQKMILKIQKNY